MAVPLPTTVALLILVSSLPIALAADAPAEGDFVVGFRALPDEARAGSYAGERVERVDDALRFAVVHAKNADAFAQRAAHDPNVRYVQPEVYATTEAAPNDPYYSYQFGWARVNALAAWNTTPGSSSVTVAVIDSGVDRAHPDLAGSRLKTGYDFFANDADPTDDCGHGTGVTGVVGASTNNGVGVAGGAQVSIMPLRALGMNATGSCNGPFSAVASAIRYAADNGARVISMSLGCKGCYDQPTNDAIEYAWGKGVLLVGSAGNSGPCTDCVSWPAAHARVIAVAATDTNNVNATFSSKGADVEMAAPGKNIYTTVKGGGYGPMSGTSLAAPHVSAAAALAFSANGALTNAQVRALLASTAKDLGTAGVDQTFGAGLVDYGALVAAASSGAAPSPPPANTAPTASFTVSASNLTASVDGSGSSDAESGLTYSWTWGDGLGFSSGDCPTAAHTYAAAGTYTIRLTVTDAAGATATTTRTVTVTAPASEPTPPPAPAPAPTPTSHVDAIGGLAKASGKTVKLTWTPAIVDDERTPLAGATVSATLTGPTGKTMSATTATNGVATFVLSVAKGQTWTLCVSGVAASGHDYDSAANVVTCRTLSS